MVDGSHNPTELGNLLWRAKLGIDSSRDHFWGKVECVDCILKNRNQREGGKASRRTWECYFISKAETIRRNGFTKPLQGFVAKGKDRKVNTKRDRAERGFPIPLPKRCQYTWLTGPDHAIQYGLTTATGNCTDPVPCLNGQLGTPKIIIDRVPETALSRRFLGLDCTKE